MHRILFNRLLLITLAACGFVTQSEPDVPTFHSKSTLRNCNTRYELRATGEAISGIRGETKRYPAAQRFSDNWIDVEWLSESRELRAHITNKTQAPITIESVIVGPEKTTTAMPVMQIGPRSSHHVPMASVAVIQQYLHIPGSGPRSRATNAVPVELRVRIADSECSYHFQLVSGAV